MMETLFIDPLSGDDANPGTQDAPFRTVAALLLACMARGLTMVNIIEKRDGVWYKVGA